MKALALCSEASPDQGWPKELKLPQGFDAVSCRLAIWAQKLACRFCRVGGNNMTTYDRPNTYWHAGTLAAILHNHLEIAQRAKP